jgi:acetyl-CoA synthetase
VGPRGLLGRARQALDWIKPYTKVKNTSFAHDNVSIKWFEDGTLNVAANCIDRHLATRGDQTAIIWEPDDPNEPPSTSPTRSCTPRSARWPTS